MSELKPCPFCGGEAYFVRIFSLCPFQSRVKCRKCGIGTIKYSSPNALDVKILAREAWNRRVEHE